MKSYLAFIGVVLAIGLIWIFGLSSVWEDLSKPEPCVHVVLTGETRLEIEVTGQLVSVKDSSGTFYQDIEQRGRCK